MSEAPVIWLPNGNRNVDCETAEKLIRSLVLASEAKAQEHGWPLVLDSLLSAYLSIAVVKIRPEILTALLRRSADDVPRFAAVVRAHESKAGGRA